MSSNTQADGSHAAVQVHHPRTSWNDLHCPHHELLEALRERGSLRRPASCTQPAGSGSGAPPCWPARTRRGPGTHPHPRHGPTHPQSPVDAATAPRISPATRPAVTLTRLRSVSQGGSRTYVVAGSLEVHPQRVQPITSLLSEAPDYLERVVGSETSECGVLIPFCQDAHVCEILYAEEVAFTELRSPVPHEAELHLAPGRGKALAAPLRLRHRDLEAAAHMTSDKRRCAREGVSIGK